MSRRAAIYSQRKRLIELTATWYQGGTRDVTPEDVNLANNQVYNDVSDFARAGRWISNNESYNTVFAVGVAFDSAALAAAAAAGTPKSIKLRMYVTTGSITYFGSAGSATNIGISTKYNAYVGSDVWSYAYQHNGEKIVPSVITPQTSSTWVDIDLGTTIPTYGYVLSSVNTPTKAATAFGIGSDYTPKLLIEY